MEGKNISKRGEGLPSSESYTHFSWVISGTTVKLGTEANEGMLRILNARDHDSRRVYFVLESPGLAQTQKPCF